MSLGANVEQVLFRLGCVKYEFISELKELLLLNSISQTITNKKEKSNNKQRRKNQNQAYIKVDLDLDDS